MGRIKTLLAKRITRKLINEYGDKFTDDFNKNKLLVSEFTKGTSRKLRNVIAGYATRLVKQRAEKVPVKRHQEEDLSKYY